MSSFLARSSGEPSSRPTTSSSDPESESWFQRARGLVTGRHRHRSHSHSLEKYPYSRTSPWSSSSSDVYHNAYTYGPGSSSSSFRKVSLPSYNSGSGSGSGSGLGSVVRSRRWWLNWNLRSWFRRRRSSSLSTPSKVLSSSASASTSTSVKGRVQGSRGWTDYRVSWWSDIPIWRYLRITFISVLLTWSIYCTIRYFMSLTVYDDPIRRRIAISLGTLSILSTLFFALETSVVYALAMHLHIPTTPRTFIHFLTYFASFLVLIPAIVNVGVVLAWRFPPASFQDFERAIRGRCTWDVDAVWTGTGMVCFGADEVSFGVWVGAGVVRLLSTFVVVSLYFVVARYFPRPDEEPVPLPLEAGNQMDELTTDPDIFTPPKVKQLIYNQPHSLSSAQILRHVTAMSANGSGSNSVSGSDENEDENEIDDNDDYDEEYTSDLGDLENNTHTKPSSYYARVLTDEPIDHNMSSSLSLSQLSLSRSSLSLSLDRSNLSPRGPGLGQGVAGPRPRPGPRPKPSLASISRTSTISSTTTAVATGTGSTLSSRDTPTPTQTEAHGHEHSEELDSQSLLEENRI